MSAAEYELVAIDILGSHHEACNQCLPFIRLFHEGAECHHRPVVSVGVMAYRILRALSRTIGTC